MLRFFSKFSLFAVVLTLLLVLFLTAAFAHRIFYLVESGHVGVLYRFFSGTETKKTYSEGLVVVFPWNTLHQYSVRELEISEQVQVLSYNGLEISVQFSFRFQPDLNRVGELHVQLGPDYVETLVRPVLVATVREVIGNYRPEELFTTHSATLQDEIKQISQREIDPFHIRITQILVKNVKMPPVVEQAIQEKLVLQQIAEGYDFRLVTEERERMRREIEGEGLSTFHKKLTENLSPAVLSYLRIQAMRELASSQNAKLVFLNTPEDLPLQLPIQLDGFAAGSASSAVGAVEPGPTAESKSSQEQDPANPSSNSSTPERKTGEHSAVPRSKEGRDTATKSPPAGVPSPQAVPVPPQKAGNGRSPSVNGPVRSEAASTSSSEGGKGQTIPQGDKQHKGTVQSTPAVPGGQDLRAPPEMDAPGVQAPQPKSSPPPSSESTSEKEVNGNAR